MSEPETLIIRAVVCRWVLAEVLGRPDLAASIGTNRAGAPMRAYSAYTPDDAALVAEAFALANKGSDSFVFDLDDHIARLQEDLTAAASPDLLERGKHWSPAAGDWVPEFNIEDWVGWQGWDPGSEEEEIHLFLFALPAELHPHPDLYVEPGDLVAVETCCMHDAVLQMSAVTQHWVDVFDSWDEEDLGVVEGEWADACWLALGTVIRGTVN